MFANSLYLKLIPHCVCNISEMMIRVFTAAQSCGCWGTAVPVIKGEVVLVALVCPSRSDAKSIYV